MNVLAITGRLVADPARRTAAGGVVCEFRLAVDGKPRLWLNVEVWGNLAGRRALHLRSGRRVAVTGSLRCDEYVTRAGEKASSWYLRATSLTYLDAATTADHRDTDEEVVV